MKPRTLVLLALALPLAIGACKSNDPADPRVEGTPPAAAAAAPAPWPDARSKSLAELALPSGEKLGLVLRHEPATSGTAATLVLAFEGEAKPLWTAALEPPERDRLWNASWVLAAEPAPGDRLAISADGGARYGIVLATKRGRIFCPHLHVPGQGGAPAWEKAPSIGAWIAQVLQTAVWGCDASGGGCKSSALAGGPVHSTTAGGDELLPKPRLEELREALALLDEIPIDHRIATALFDAAVTYQHGLEAGELEKLALLTAKAIGPQGPLDEETRKALTLRLMLARSEAKKTPPQQLSPRLTLEKLAAAMQALPAEPVGGRTQ